MTHHHPQHGIASPLLASLPPSCSTFSAPACNQGHSRDFLEFPLPPLHNLIALVGLRCNKAGCLQTRRSCFAYAPPSCPLCYNPWERFRIADIAWQQPDYCVLYSPLYSMFSQLILFYAMNSFLQKRRCTTILNTRCRCNEGHHFAKTRIRSANTFRLTSGVSVVFRDLCVSISR